MFVIVAFPWPAPSANAEPAGLTPARLQTTVAATDAADAVAETRPLCLAHVEELICWTRRERLHLLWYRFQLTAREIFRLSRRAGESRLNANRG